MKKRKNLLILSLTLFTFLFQINFFFNSTKVYAGETKEVLLSKFLMLKTNESLNFQSIILTKDGGYVAVGDVPSKVKNEIDAIIIKFDKNGNVLWEYTYDKGYDDRFLSVIETDDGGFLAVGFAYAFGIIVKFDRYGNFRWDKVSKFLSVYKYITKAKNGDYIVTGPYFRDYFVSDRDALIMRVDKEGNIIWKNTYLGEDYDDVFFHPYELDDGSIITYVDTYSGSEEFKIDNWNPNIKNYPGYENHILMKWDKNGKLLWKKGIDVDRDLYLININVTKNKEIILCNRERIVINNDTNNVKYRGLFVKTDLDGNVKNYVEFNGDRNSFFYDVLETRDGGFLALGYEFEKVDNTYEGETFSDDYDNVYRIINYILIKYDKNNNLEWKYPIENKYELYEVEEFGNGKYVVAGDFENKEDGKTSGLVLEIIENNKFDLSFNLDKNEIYTNENVNLFLVDKGTGEKINVTWESSDKNIAYVSSDNKLVLTGTGNVTITAKTLDGKYKLSKELTIKKLQVKGIKLDKTSLTLSRNKIYNLKASLITDNGYLNPNDGEYKLIWQSSNKNIVSVNQYGKIIALRKGKAVITAKTSDGKYIARCVVNVK